MDSVTGPTRSPIDRERVLDRIVTTASGDSASGDGASGDTAPPVVVVAGQGGIGRTAVLTEARQRLATRGVQTVVLRVTRNDHTRPNAVAARLAAELGALSTSDSDTRRGGEGWRGGEGYPAVARGLAVAIAARAPLAVFVDDAQWIDRVSLSALAGLVQSLVGTRVTVICGLRTPAPADNTVLAGLRAAGLAEVLALRPLAAAAVDALVTATEQARPSAGLSAELRRTCRGVPAAVLAALDGHRATDSLRVVDRHVYLVEPGRPAELPVDAPVFERLRGLGEPAWAVLKALAVLHPLGDVGIELIAEAVGRSVEEVTEQLTALAGEGLLRPGGRWRFRLPLLAESLPVCLGPYERRHLAQLAVTAIWDGKVEATQDYLADQIVAAGRLVDPRRAGTELLGIAAGRMLDDGYHTDRWLRGALELIDDPAQRVGALFLLAATCGIHLRFRGAVESAWRLLSGPPDALPAERMTEVAMIYLVGLTGTLDRYEVTEIAERTWASLPGSDGHRLVFRASALCHLDRWQEGYQLLTDGRDVWREDNDAVAAFGQTFVSGSAAFLGQMAEFNGYVADPTQGRLWNVDRHRLEHLAALSRILLSFGELARAEELLAEYGVPRGQRPAPDDAVAAMLGGRWDEALDLARVSLATGTSLGYGPAHAEMSKATSTILAARGRLAQARSVLETAKATRPALGHILAQPESAVERVQGNKTRAEQLLWDAVAQAGRSGLVVATEELWLELTGFRMTAGDAEGGRHCLTELAGLAERLGTGRATLMHLVARAFVEGDTAVAASAVALARERGQPYELARTMHTLAGRELVPATLLPEAYELLGELDALLPRSRLRRVMRKLSVPVPGRNATVAENERLLGALVAEGLTNRELAVVLGDSEKSVEGRLSRLLQRTGYRSRVELATAMLTGEYPAA